MIPFPLALEPMIGKLGMYLVFLVIGLAFGYVLESSGFNHSPSMAAQFYFKDLRVFKVFFTAIVVAMILVFGASAIGLLDYNLIWVNPTYLWSGIVGGLIMGVGFILGGFCPGTSLTALGTLKVDGILFVLGGLFGVFLFGETVDKMTYFFNGSYFGRLTLMDFFNLPTGVVVIFVTLMAIFMLWGGEKLEQKFGGKSSDSEPRARYIGAGVLVVLALAIALIGQPTTTDRWEMLAPEKDPQLDQRVYQVSPAELLDTMHEYRLNLIMVDVRDEADYNIFHLLDAEHIPLMDIQEHIDRFIAEPEYTLFVLMSNDETAATKAWKIMVANAVPNVYILDGGINNWLDTYGTPYEAEFCAGKIDDAGDDELHYDFKIALGAGCPAAFPDPEAFDFEFEPKIKIEQKRAPSSGGCG